MNQISYNILRRAQNNAREIDRLDSFLKENGVNLGQLKREPELYEEIIRQYSKSCISIGLYEESRERLEKEFNKLCEFHKRNEADLVERFTQVLKELISDLSTSYNDRV